MNLKPILPLLGAYAAALCYPTLGESVSQAKLLGASPIQWLMGVYLFLNAAASPSSASHVASRALSWGMLAIVTLVPLLLTLFVYCVASGLAAELSLIAERTSDMNGARNRLDAMMPAAAGLVIASGMPIAGTATYWMHHIKASKPLTNWLLLSTSILSPAVLLLANWVLAKTQVGQDFAIRENQDAVFVLGLSVFSWVLFPLMLGRLFSLRNRENAKKKFEAAIVQLGGFVIAALNYCSCSVLVGHLNEASQLLGPSFVSVLLYMVLLRLKVWGMAKLPWLETTELTDTLLLGCLLRNTGAGLVITASLLPDQPAIGVSLATYALIQHFSLLIETKFRKASNGQDSQSEPFFRRRCDASTTSKTPRQRTQILTR